MNKDQFLKAQELLREVDLLSGLLNGSLESSGWIRVKRSTISQPEVYPQSHRVVTALINDPDGIKITISESWKKEIIRLKSEIESQFEKL